MSDLADWQVHGPVRTLRQERAAWDFDRDTWQPPRTFSFVTFRRDGQAIQCESHNVKGTSRWLRLYDDTGRLVETQYWIDDGPKCRVLQSYDAEGRPSEAVELAPDGARRMSEIWRYDGGRKTKMRHLPLAAENMSVAGFAVEGSEVAYGAPGAVTLTVTYDDQQLPVDASFRDANAQLVRRVAFSRDAAGRIVREVVYLGEPNSWFGTLLSDGDHDAIQAAFPDRMFASTDNAYDGRGRLTERVMRMGLLGEHRVSFEYDDFDNPIVETSQDRQQEMYIDDDGVARQRDKTQHVHETRFAYRYDAAANWIERVTSITGEQGPELEPAAIERRTIDYYEEQIGITEQSTND